MNFYGGMMNVNHGSKTKNNETAHVWIFKRIFHLYFRILLNQGSINYGP
jgi:hypothetical protein